MTRPGNRARICAVIVEETMTGARAALRRAAAAADLAELRLDALRDFDFGDPDQLGRILEEKPLPVILTCRSIEEGGRQAVDETARLRLLVEGARRWADYCDIEAASYDAAKQFAPDLEKLIVSYHNFTETPADIETIYERLIKLPAAIHKIAVTANRATDCLPVFRLLDRAREEGRDLIAIAMGPRGLMTRVLGPSRGAFLTFGALTRGAESAPGQPTCAELRDLYRIDSITRDTQLFAVAGLPVHHSASPAMHNAAFAALELDAVYLPVEVENIAEFIHRCVAPNRREIDLRWRGLSVTIPHKQAVIEALDETSERAIRIGAVNTVTVEGERLLGDNTDAQGAIAPLEAFGELAGVSCAVIGAGGAARAVIDGLRERRARVTIFARDPKKAQPVSEAFGVPVEPLIGLLSSDAEIVINATPVGMQGHSEGQSPVPRAALRGRRVVYDLVYNPPDTTFLRDARELGCIILNGLEMLVNQAAAQFEIWTGRPTPVKAMRHAATQHLNRMALEI